MIFIVDLTMHAIFYMDMYLNGLTNGPILLPFEISTIRLLLSRSFQQLWVPLYTTALSSHESNGTCLPLQTVTSVFLCLYVIIKASVSFWKI